MNAQQWKDRAVRGGVYLTCCAFLVFALTVFRQQERGHLPLEVSPRKSSTHAGESEPVRAARLRGEDSAFQVLMGLYAAEESFRDRVGRYGSLDELARVGVWEAPLDGETHVVSGYRLRCRPGITAYTVVAVPPDEDWRTYWLIKDEDGDRISMGVGPFRLRYQCRRLTPELSGESARADQPTSIQP